MPNIEVRFAQNQEERENIYKLRYEVFNLELKEGLESSQQQQKDKDEYDKNALHLIGLDKKTGEIIATYRLQNIETAEKGVGFYCQSLFKIKELPQTILENGIELSRACIHKDYRGGITLYLLWKSLINYIIKSKKRYLFGSCSFPGTNFQEAYNVSKYIKEKLFLHEKIQIPSQDKNKLSISQHIDLKENFDNIEIPPLFNAYIRNGCKVCSDVAIDYSFNTFDFMILLDISTINPKILNKYAKNSSF